jgi:DNA-binding NarL/FixJ family response regulator
MTALSVPPPSSSAARPSVTCSHCGAELTADAFASALLAALQSSPAPEVPVDPPRSSDPAGLLRPREREVARLLGEGWRVVTIAQRLGISEHTVRKHLRGAYTALGVHSQAQLVECLRATDIPESRVLRAVDPARVELPG